jgi:light-regulated signal transduction histidine kinase (bacteriophytochrome)
MELERSNAELEQFAHVVSHDLQEPLHTLSGFLELLDDQYSEQLDDEGRMFVERARAGTDRMRRLVLDLLEYARVSTKGQEFETVDTQALVDGVIDELAPVIAEAGATVEAAGLPVLEGDRFQLAQLFRNLVDNAIKFHADAPPLVRVLAERRENEWLFRVTDNGIGIDERYTIHVFTIFQRLHSREEYSGTGVGLAISKKIVERHGGRIWVESQVGAGSTFCFTLPE